jgi:hypothetical protein
MTEFRSSRFLLWDKPSAIPYFDIIHQDTRGPVFDLGIHLDSYDGSVYIHQDDIIEMARTLGMATAEEVDNMQSVIDSLRAQVNKLPKAEEALRNGLDSAVSQFYRDLHTDESDVVPEPNESAEDDIVSIITKRYADGAS